MALSPAYKLLADQRRPTIYDDYSMFGDKPFKTGGGDYNSGNGSGGAVAAAATKAITKTRKKTGMTKKTFILPPARRLVEIEPVDCSVVVWLRGNNRDCTYNNY